MAEWIVIILCAAFWGIMGSLIYKCGYNHGWRHGYHSGMYDKDFVRTAYEHFIEKS